MTEPPVTRTIARALSDVMEDVRAVAKSDKNDAQGFSFRGIDAVVNAVGPALRRHHVVVLPIVESVERTEIAVGSNRRPLGHVAVVVRYRFTGPDGDYLDAVVPGEAMDPGDKATPKAMSVAFRTALLQALALPTDDPDPDAATYERTPRAVVTDPDWLLAQIAAINGAGSDAELDEIGRGISIAGNAGKVSQTDRANLATAWSNRRAELGSVTA